MSDRLAMVRLGLLAGLWLASVPARGDAPRVDYNREIRPILSNFCFKCHGPDEKERQGGLRLDTREGALAPADSGAAAIVPGRSRDSELLVRVTSADPAEQMPPPATGKRLSPAQIELLTRWIDEGAPLARHWAFVPPVRPELPPIACADDVRNPVDRFVFARLEREGMRPAPAADRVTLIRRLSLDLTGLPPAPAEVDLFVADRAPDAYERLVERLLASSRYGEHQARYWLDAARYGDTHGMHIDSGRTMWPYRDWVIGAFNANMPFDRFTIEQLAGDLLPNATLDQKIATGFNRCNVTTSEMGSIDEEWLVRYTVDRVETVSTIWLGLTLGCAVCHDHKYDPVTQRDFYQLFAFFNSIAENAMDNNASAPPPMLRMPTAAQSARLADLSAELAATRRKISEALAAQEYADPAPAADAAPRAPREWVWLEDALPADPRPVGSGKCGLVAAADGPVQSGQKSLRHLARGESQMLVIDPSARMRVADGDRLFAWVYLDPRDPPREIMLEWNDGTWEHRAFWGEDLIQLGLPNLPGRIPMGPLPEPGKWVRLEVDPERVGLGMAFVRGWGFTQHGGTVYWDRAGIKSAAPQPGEPVESLAAWEAFERTQSKSPLPANVQQALKVEPAQRTDEQRRLLRDFFVEHVCASTRSVFEPLHRREAELLGERMLVESAVTTTMVSADLPQPRDAFVLVRGEYDKKGEKVRPATPAALLALRAGASPTRLGLAQWLVDPEHPLTARVTVNRFWQQIMGNGLVRTTEDFGSQGELPSHPELLDWLAVDFRESGWDVKRLLRQIVTSATYRQSSRISPELARRDPENRLLARGPRFRLDGEVLRDSALLAGGLLAERVGGQSVKPYQPAGLWESVSFIIGSARTYQPDAGDGLYRRSVYTFWKRTAPPPALLTFDAPTRDFCVVRRARTNTPLQALVLLNDTQFVEAARKLAERALREGGASPADRAAWAFRLAVSRPPSRGELDALLRAFESQWGEFRADPAAAVELLKVGASPAAATADPAELAAWTMVANLILNLDETVTRE